MHRAYFDGLVSAAWADGELKEDEWSDIQTIGELLEIDEEAIEAASSRPSGVAPTLTTGWRLSPGDTVVITGDTVRSRSEWFRLLQERGYLPKESMAKTAKVVMAADPDSASGKARMARRWGIPIITEAGLQRMLGL